MITEEMFGRQSGIFSPQQQEQISRQKVVIVGIGALGQMAAETCVRSGYRHLILIDGDSFDYSNFNRQLYANTETIGTSKVEAARQVLSLIRPDLDIKIRKDFMRPESDTDMISEDSIILDCTDDVSTKIYLEELAERKNIPLIHGAIDGWYGQVAAVFPGDGILKKIYQGDDRKIPDALMVTSSVTASFQVRTLIGVTLGEIENLRKKIIFIDMNQNEIQTVAVGSQ